MDYRRKHGRNEEISQDSPTYSRLFVVSERGITDDIFREAFCKFGHIEDIRIPRDHNTGDCKGIAYIKFSKTSEAAHALEEMNLKVLPKTVRPLKVMVAYSRSAIQTEDYDENYKRLFITIPKSMTENEIKDIFSAYGNIEFIHLQRDRNSGDSKGFAYVKYNKFSEAARAYEECDKRYRAIFAMPKSQNNKRSETPFESNINSLASTSSKTSLLAAMNVRPEGYTKVNFMCPPYLTQFNIKKLFGLIPGMIQCQYFVDLMNNYGKGTVTYSNPTSATYAVQKLNRFEYPPGVKIFVKPDDNSKFDSYEENFNNIPNAVSNLRNAITSTTSSATPDLAQLTEAIAEASKLIKIATGGSDSKIPDSTDFNYCSVKLPPPQPLADIDSPLAKRCFLVCKPNPPPLSVLRDVFCRFGDLINVYTLPNKTIGYARYASNEAADRAIEMLHGSEICGVRMRVLEAEEEQPPKRTRYD